MLERGVSHIAGVCAKPGIEPATSGSTATGPNH